MLAWFFLCSNYESINGGGATLTGGKNAACRFASEKLSYMQFAVFHTLSTQSKLTMQSMYSIQAYYATYAQYANTLLQSTHSMHSFQAHHCKVCIVSKHTMQSMHSMQAHFCNLQPPFRLLTLGKAGYCKFCQTSGYISSTLSVIDCCQHQ